MKVFLKIFASVACLMAMAAGVAARPADGSPRGGLLWIVDSVALEDSVFCFSPAQMRSDSAAVVAAGALNRVFAADIDTIMVADSGEAAACGYPDRDGIVRIETKVREPILIFGSYGVHKSLERVSAGSMLGDSDWARKLVLRELPDIEEYGIRKISIVERPHIGCQFSRSPIIIVETEQRYYSADNFIGTYTAEKGKNTYTLDLKADSSFVFTHTIRQKKTNTTAAEVGGTWRKMRDTIELSASADASGSPTLLTPTNNIISIKFSNYYKLTLPPDSFANKKAITLTRPTSRNAK